MGKHFLKKKKPVLLLAALGAITGLFSSYAVLTHFYGRTIDEAALLASLPGLPFGVAMCAFLAFQVGLPALHGYFVIGIFGASWLISYWGTLYFYGSLIQQTFYQTFYASNTEIIILAFVGAIAGLIGAGIIVSGLAVVLAQYRDVSFARRTLLVGSAVGLLLPLTIVPYFTPVFFVLWQAAVAVCLGLGLDQPSTDAEI
ncbi:hypothetical protein ACFQ3C_18710 [Seohaeicola saemankumensis]|uniref:Uncharacterized protein n=1 Tax=Seohaeicola saemankumensis TaxID=481181 RepID=A0ABW3THN2_9RHOB